MTITNVATISDCDHFSDKHSCMWDKKKMLLSSYQDYIITIHGVYKQYYSTCIYTCCTDSSSLFGWAVVNVDWYHVRHLIVIATVSCWSQAKFEWRVLLIKVILYPCYQCLDSIVITNPVIWLVENMYLTHYDILDILSIWQLITTMSCISNTG